MDATQTILVDATLLLPVAVVTTATAEAFYGLLFFYSVAEATVDYVVADLVLDVDVMTTAAIMVETTVAVI